MSDRAEAGGRLRKFVYGFLCLFLIIFPKGGIKFGSIPLTWGYAAIFVLFGILSLKLIASFLSLRYDARRLFCFVCLIPFHVCFFYSYFMYGVQDLGFFFSLCVSFIVLPFFFYVLANESLTGWSADFLLRAVRISIFVVAAYGIFLFIYRIYSGSFVEIPYLTINAGDAGGIDEKYNDRGGIFKLISTYNNGNIYGVCILMLLPLFQLAEKSIFKSLVVKGSLILTLSRTVWLGLIFYEILRLFFGVSFARAVRFVVSLGILLAFLTLAAYLIGWDAGFLFDSDLGGRAGQLSVFDELSLFPSKSFLAISEIVYLSILEFFGIAGLVAFLLGMLMPLFLFWRGDREKSKFKIAVAQGMIVYLFCCVSDGAMLFIPVMCFYWCLASFLFVDSTSSNVVRS